MMEKNHVIDMGMGLITPLKDEGDDEARRKAIHTTLRNKFEGIKDGHKERAAQPESHKELERKAKLKIRKAPANLRKNYEIVKLLEPQVLVLGPIHHSKDKWAESEKFKIRLAHAFVREYYGEVSKSESLCFSILEKIEEIKDLYDEKMLINYNDVDLSVMLFLDGCALIYYVTRFMEDGLDKETDYPVQLINKDLFLLENQLPYYVLELLSKGSKMGKNLGETMDKFVRLQWSSLDYARQAEAGKNAPDATHLLEHLWLRITSFTEANAVLRERSTKSKQSHEGSTPSTIRHRAKKLKEVRIHFRPRKSTRLQDISFTSQCASGYLEIPPLSIDDHTASKLANLIAMEQCEGFTGDSIVSAYVWFLDSLIEEDKDVFELRLDTVLSSFRPTDAEIQKLIKLVATNGSPNYSIYSKVNKEIQDYLDNTGKITLATWLALAAQEYFKTPFSTIAVVAAGLTILLTIIQSYFSVFPRNCS